MRIAFVTYEYPPDIPKGGIATYVEQASRLLNERGNGVEIFCASYTRSLTENNNGISINRCLIKNISDFQKACLNKFTERHESNPFDIIESPEIHADALLIKKKYPLLPLVVKLHMASFIQNRLLNFYIGRLAKIRYFLGGIKRGRINYYGSYNFLNDIEYQFTTMAEGIVAPSRTQQEIISREWHVPMESISIIPNPFSPSKSLLEIPVILPLNKVVTFVGKLNVHKGIVNLIKVIPLVVKYHPEAVFRLIGNDSYFAVKKMNMSDFIKGELKGYEKNYELLGGIEYEDVLEQFKTTAICIFPSLWESFGLVCLEAMGAGRAVVGSSSGGMSDILSEGAGILTDPHNIKKMAKAVIELLNDKNLCNQYGSAAREKVLSTYNGHVIGNKMETYYRDIIANSKKVF